MATATKFKPTDTVVCMEAHCNPAVPQGGVVLYESEWAGDDPVVAAAPHLFTLKSASRATWKSPFDEVVATNESNARAAEEARMAARSRTARANKVKPVAPRYLTLKKDLETDVDGVPTTLQKGSQLPADHPVVQAHGDLFQ